MKYRDALGVIRRESSEMDDRREAARLLKLKEGKVRGRRDAVGQGRT